MAYNVTITPEARREYEQVLSYLSKVLNSPGAARRFADEFDHQLDSIRDNPELHALSRMPELAARGYRALIVNTYIALYKIAGDSIVIAHIFHQSQDYARLV